MVGNQVSNKTADEVVMTNKEIIARVADLDRQLAALGCQWMNQTGRAGQFAQQRIAKSFYDVEAQLKQLRATYP